MILPGTCAVLALLILGPLLGRGFVLSYDMVFAPDQDLLPDSIGTGDGLPRSVPADAVVALLTDVLPGDVVQKLILLLALFFGPLGAGRLVPTDSIGIRVVAATSYGWSAYVAERLFIGHWPYLLAYACLPWIAAAGFAVRRGEPRALPKLVLACVPAVLTPSGGIIATVMAIVCAGRLSVAAAGIVLNAPWWVPSVLHPGGTLSTADGVAAFAARAESWATPVTSVLGLGGIWNADVTPASRAIPVQPLLTLVVVAVAMFGLRTLAERWGANAIRMLLLGAFGVVVAVLGTLPGGVDVLGWAVSNIPGAGLLRDSQKWVAWWALPLALGFALGIEAAGKYLKRRAGLIAVAALLPLVSLPDLAWGGFGRLESVAYPADWQIVRRILAEDPRPGDVVTLPMQPFRQFAWNGDRTQLDPAPRFLPRTTLIDDVLYVGGRPIPDGNARLTAIREGVAQRGELGPLGVGWVLVEHGTPGRVDQGLLARTTEVWRGEWLTLYRTAGESVTGTRPAAPVLISDFAALALISGCLLWLVLPAGRLTANVRSPSL